jgi:hypothetical protein
MPNWCENTVKFTGDKEKIARLLYRLTAPVKIVAEGYLAALSFDQPPCDFAGILENKGGAEVDYRSTYNPWAALRDSSHGEYLESLIEQLQDCGELPSDIDALRQEAASWPKSWEEYKRSYRRR